MTTRRTFITLLLILISISSAYFLKGDRIYLKKISAEILIRKAIPDIKSILKNEKVRNIAFFYSGDPIFEESIRNEIKKQLKVDIILSSKHSITVKANENADMLSLLVNFDKNSRELLSKDISAKIGNWTSLIPPILAIILAICLRKVLLSLGISIWVGALIYSDFHPVKASVSTLYDYLWKSFADEFSILIFAFIFILVGMVNIINRGGGMNGIINQITKIAKSARTACISTGLLGIIIFFDDYLNTIVVGTTMRSFTDKLKVSREKLAYIVDSTSAPVAGLAILSTWIGFEVMQMQNVAEFLGINESGYSLFIKALPYRFYCVFTIIFVFMTSIFRRDFGPMLKAERRAFLNSQVDEPDTNIQADTMIKSVDSKIGIQERWQNAVVPIAVVILFMIIFILSSGYKLAETNGIKISLFSLNGIKECFILVGASGNSLFKYLLYSSILGTLTAIVMLVVQKILTIREIFKAFISGWRILPAASIILFAWGIQKVCNDLGTAVFLSSLVRDFMNPILLPLIIFILSAMVSFATGTSFGTMGLMLPTVAPLALTIGNPFVFVISLGAVLDGSIFGDHCSPISDTTVLSSISSSCNLIDHVKTQLPYAVLCMIIAAIAGYLPSAMGISPIISYPIGIILLIFTLVMFGKNPETNS